MKQREEDYRMPGYVSRTALLILLLLVLSSTYAISQETADSDSDGMPDDWELENGLDEEDPRDADRDYDMDGLSNREEYENSTDPNMNDTDEDGMDDKWELRYNLDPTDPADARIDQDRDGYSNLLEYNHSTDPRDYYDRPEGVPPDGIDGDGAPEEESADAGMSLFLCGPFLVILIGFIILIIIIAFYSKIRRDRILDHETRQKIVDYLRDNPGAHYSAVLKDLDLAHGVLTHHLNILETQEVIFSKQDRQYRRFYLDGMASQGPMLEGTQKRVMDAVRRKPGSSQSEIARYLDMGRMMVSYHVGELEKLGMVRKVREGRENRIYPGSMKVGPAVDYGMAGREEAGAEV
ncbi:MAG: winged helix-turn-helix transcriptional regulator [Thermoplasmatota archaeon]